MRPRSARPRRKTDERQSAQFRPLGHHSFAAVGTVHAFPEPGSARVLAGHLVLAALEDRKSTRLNSSHSQISYAVFCLKKKNTQHYIDFLLPHNPSADRALCARTPSPRPAVRPLLHARPPLTGLCRADPSRPMDVTIVS